MDDQWVKFQKRSKIQEENASVCEQIYQLGISLSGITRGLESEALHWLSTSHRQSLKTGPQPTHGTCEGPSTAQNAAQHKIKL